MHARPSAEAAHRIAHLRLDERVDDDGRTPAGTAYGELEIVHGFHARVADLLELLVGELRLECLDQARGGLPGGIGDDVQLDRRMLCHVGIVADNVSETLEARY